MSLKEIFGDKEVKPFIDNSDNEEKLVYSNDDDDFNFDDGFKFEDFKFDDGSYGLKREYQINPETGNILITKDMLITEVISLNPHANYIFMNYGLSCSGCPVAYGETIEEACMVHNMDLDCLLEDLNSDMSAFDELSDYDGYISDSELFDQW